MTFFVSLLFSSVGGVYLIYGKRTYSTSYLVCGALLLIVSYLIDNALGLTIVGVAVTAIPYCIKRGWV
ncbi:MAG: hypothetical protein QOJ98_2401 [Acidobacteriota bacterium]|jgi:hypothetical protein|nr:hypothetical protein [Acidobacteriota bacterium]